MRERKDKYGWNQETSEVHLLANVQPQCNLPEDVQRFKNLEDVRKAAGVKRLNRCGWCNRIKMKETSE